MNAFKNWVGDAVQKHCGSLCDFAKKLANFGVDWFNEAVPLLEAGEEVRNAGERGRRRFLNGIYHSKYEAPEHVLTENSVC